MERSRRRRVPAFGEWNYYYYSGELATPHAAAASASEWSAAGPELEASSDVWFKYSPPPRKPPPSGRKARRPEKTKDGSCGKRGLRRAVAEATPARASDAVAPSAVARTPGSNKAVAARVRVVRPVDADLYQVPPPEFGPDDDEEPPRRWHKERKNKPASRRSLWMGCFGFNCVPTE